MRFLKRILFHLRFRTKRNVPDACANVRPTRKVAQVMSRVSRSPLVAMNFNGDVMRRVTPRHVFNKAAPQQADWFRIENKSGEDKTLVYIYDEIGYWGTSASDFLKTISAIDTSEIELHVNSPGGNVWDGVAIYNSLKMHAAEVTVYVDALAASAASFIAQAGDKIIMARNAQMMIHDASAMAFGNAEDMREVADVLDRISNNIADIYAFNAGGTLTEWRDLMKEEVWFTAEEAVENGLADEMLDQADMEAEAATNKWDLSTIFNYAGRAQAPSPVKVRESIVNRVEEAQMGNTAPKNQGDPQGTQPPEGTAPEGTEEENPTPDPAPAADPAPADPAPADPAPAAPAEPAPTPAQPENKVTLSTPLMVNGSPNSSFSEVQSHITVLETFRNETIKAGRKNFVENLAKERKIAATAIDATQTFALGLSDEQYEMWKNTWDGALPVPALGQHASGSNDPSAVNNAGEKATEIEDLMEICRQHKVGGMSPEAIKKTDSYNKLIALKPDYEL